MRNTLWKTGLIIFCLFIFVFKFNAVSPVTICQIDSNTPNLSGLWHFSEGTGLTSYDSSGYGGHATLVDNFEWEASKFGNGIHFSNAANLVTISSNTENIKTDVITIMFWIRKETDDETEHILKSWEYGAGDYRSWIFLYLTGADTMCWWATANGVDEETVDVDFNAYINNWTHIAGVYDGTDMILYFNAVEVGRTSIASILSAPFPIHISDNGSTYEGSMDEIAIFNRALSVAELKDIYYKNPRVNQ